MAWRCRHHDREEYARGLCDACYTGHWQPQDLEAPRCAIHPQRVAVHRGLCEECLRDDSVT